MKDRGLEAKRKSDRRRLRKRDQKSSERVITKHGEWSGCPERLPGECHRDELQQPSEVLEATGKGSW